MSARCYSKCLPTTRQQQQEQRSRPEAGHDSRQGSPRGPRKPHAVPQNAAHANGNSGMGPEPDSRGSEEKQLPDSAFRSLSPPPPLDYLDVCDSSSRSSADDSQVSTNDNSAASTWYAELNVSAQSDSDKDSLSHQQLADLHDDNNYDGECFGAGGFECVDVALESREVAGRGVAPKTVPKRQIHLRRCSTEESLATASGRPGAGTPTKCHGHPKAALSRQYSTPAAIQAGSYGAGPESPPGNRKQRLQKSISLDETSSKTKMASSLIKNVLSKKMQVELKIQQQNPDEEGFSQSSPVRESSKTRPGNTRHPGPRWGRSWSQEGPPVQAELDPQADPVQQYGNVSTKRHQKVLEEHFSIQQSARGRPAEFDGRGTGRSNPQMSRRENPTEREEQLAGSGTGERARRSGDSAKTSAGNAASTWARAAGGAEGECQASPRYRFPPELPEIALAPHVREKKRESSDCLPSNVEIRVAVEAVRPLCDMAEEARESLGGAGGSENKANGEKSQTVAPLHRVTDMRKLVKSTYSSPFNFSTTSGEGHPGKKMLVFPRISAQTPPDGVDETGSHCVIYAVKGAAHMMSCDETMAVPSVLELGAREARVPPNVQKTLPKSTSTKKSAVTVGYNPQLKEEMTTPCYWPKPSVLPTLSYAEKPEKLRGVSVSTYKHQQASVAAAAAPTRSLLPTATATPTYKMPRHDLTSCYSEGTPIAGIQESCGLPLTRCQDRRLPLSVETVQSHAKSGYYPQAPPSLRHALNPPASPTPSQPHPGPLNYQAVSFNSKNSKPMQAPAVPTPLLLPHPKDARHPQGHGTLQNTPPDSTQLTRDEQERGRSRSPHRTPPAFSCGPGAIPATFDQELGGQAAGASKAPYQPGGGGLVFGQNQRRLLLDPDTGTCFYVEMPAQPRRKLLFDPESGQYMEVLVPPQALYPPSLNPYAYPYLPSPGIYPPQYLPYSVLSLPQGP